MSTAILGLSAGFHDAAAALVVDGTIVAAVEEERLSRKKHDASFPVRAADVCLAIGGLAASDIDVVAFHEKPLGVLGRHVASRLRAGPRAFPGLFGATPGVLRRQLSVGHEITSWFRSQGSPPPVLHVSEHHTSHAAAAFFPSPFDDAAVLTVDGVGEWATSTMGEGRGRRLRVDDELRYPDSVGLLYSAFTEYCGFRVNGGEGELMGLAAFAEPTYADRIRDHLVAIHDDGSITLDQRYFAYIRGRRTTNRQFHELFGGPPTQLGTDPGQREAELAASIQVVLEEILMAMSRRLKDRTGLDRLCLAGGVALNCVANGRLLTDGPFSEIWVQPAAGDAGNAVGAALWSWHEVLGNGRSVSPDAMHGAFLGPRFSSDEIVAWLDQEQVPHRRAGDRAELVDEVAGRLAAGQVVGWFCGRMEFGPRALGHRSILADPRSATVQRRLNALVKERARFRPFAPAVLRSHVNELFELDADAPFMTLAVPVDRSQLVEVEDLGDGAPLEARVAQVRSTLPAVTHVDHSARVQTVDAKRNPELAELLEAFLARTGFPALLNTSFNARDEPIVCTPEDAYRTFRRTGLDLLVLEDVLVEAS